MKRHFRKFALAVFALALIGSGLVLNSGLGRGKFTSTARAQGPFPRTHECTAGTIKGRYGALFTGAFLPNNPLGVPGGTAISGRLIYNFDGNGGGQVEGNQISAFAGAFAPGGPNNLTYKVKADCIWEDEVNYDNLAPGLRSPAYGVIVSGGEEIMGTFILNGVLEGTIVAKRID
jgi:hypothetical protein